MNTRPAAWLALAFAVLFLPGPSAFAQQKLDEHATSRQFSVGQVWSYATRPGEEGSRVHVGRIESISGHVIVHVKLTGLRIRSGSQTASVVGHMPIAEESLAQSVTRLEGEPADLAGFEEGYAGWRQEFDAGRAGYFTSRPAELVDMLEKSLARSDGEENAREP